MTIVVGLGNPGSEYAHTRHNIGFMVVDQLAAQSNLTWQESKKFKAEVAQQGQTWFLKPLTFMNASGQAVKAVGDFYKVFAQPEWGKKVFVVHDDLDLEFGKFKVQYGTGPKIHNGLLSLYQHLGTHDFWHIRVGVDNRGGDRTLPGHEYVLNSFMPAEKKMLEEVISQVTQRLSQELKHG